jgi:hypothetical protein
VCLFDCCAKKKNRNSFEILKILLNIEPEMIYLIELIVSHIEILGFNSFEYFIVFFFSFFVIYLNCLTLF